MRAALLAAASAVTHASSMPRNAHYDDAIAELRQQVSDLTHRLASKCDCADAAATPVHEGSARRAGAASRLKVMQQTHARADAIAGTAGEAQPAAVRAARARAPGQVPSDFDLRTAPQFAACSGTVSRVHSIGLGSAGGSQGGHNPFALSGSMATVDMLADRNCIASAAVCHGTDGSIHGHRVHQRLGCQRALLWPDH